MLGFVFSQRQELRATVKYPVKEPFLLITMADVMILDIPSDARRWVNGDYMLLVEV